MFIAIPRETTRGEKALDNLGTGFVITTYAMLVSWILSRRAHAGWRSIDEAQTDQERRYTSSQSR